MRRWVGRVTGILGLITSGSAWADCSPAGAPQPHYSIYVPAKLVMQPVPVGGVLASFESKAVNDVYGVCNYHSLIKTTLDTRGREPSGIPNVYKTNIEGVGIRITGWANNQLHFTPPSESFTPPRGEWAHSVPIVHKSRIYTNRHRTWIIRAGDH
jgi:hypothetical protein